MIFKRILDLKSPNLSKFLSPISRQKKKISKIFQAQKDI